MSIPRGRCLASCFACMVVVLMPSRLAAGISATGIYPLLPDPPPTHWSPSSVYYILIGPGVDGTGGIAVTDGSSITKGIVIADGPGSIGSLVVEDMDSVINGGIVIGNGGQVLAPDGISSIDVGGTGDLIVRNGGRIAGSLTFGAKINSMGAGLVENTGTVVSGDVIQVGHIGTGSLTIRDQAHVIGLVDVGHFRTGVGEIVVSGSGSKLMSGSSLYGLGDTLLLGSAGEGTLRVEAGGYASAVNATLGEFYNSKMPKGQATITGAGSTWEVWGTLVVGADSGADNAVTVENGGLLRTGAATISWGRTATTSGNGRSRGRVAVTGAGSTWINENGPLVIGGGGLATLTIADGGALINNSPQSAVVGSMGVATADDDIIGNSVLVTGAGSRWTNAGDLQIGYRTRATVEIADGGKIAAAQVSLDGFRYQYPSLLILRGDDNGRGVLETARVLEGPGPGGGSIAGTLKDYGGAVQFDGGILRATQHEADFIRNFEDGEITVTGNGAWLDTNGFDVGLSAAIGGSGGITKIGAGTLTLSGVFRTDGPLTVEAGTFQLGNGGATGSLEDASPFGVNPGMGGVLPVSGALFHNVAVGAGATFAFNRSDASWFRGAISGAGSVVQRGAGTTVLDGAHTYAGPTTVEAGTLQFARAGSLYGGNAANWTAANLIVNAGATAAFNVGGDLGFSASEIAFLATLGVSDGGFRNGSFLGIDTTYAAGGEFAYSGNLANPNGGANALGLVKLGAGTLVLEGVNTYTGATRVKAGTLKLAPAAALSGTQRIEVSAGATFDVRDADFHVGADQTLAADGAILGNVTLDGALSPGFSPGLMHFDGDLWMSSSADVFIELGGMLRGSTYDAVDVTGDLHYAGALTLSLIDGFTPSFGQTFLLFHADGETSGVFSSIAFSEAGYAADFDAGTGMLTITAIPVPEPANFALIAGLGTAMTLTCRRRGPSAG